MNRNAPKLNSRKERKDLKEKSPWSGGAEEARSQSRRSCSPSLRFFEFFAANFGFRD